MSHKPENERAREIALKLEAFDAILSTLTHISQWNLKANPGHIDHRCRQQVVDEARSAVKCVESLIGPFSHTSITLTEKGKAALAEALLSAD